MPLPLASETRERWSHLVLAGLVVFVVAFAAWAHWSAVWGVDSRTFFEMTDGVARHGLPYIENGDAVRFEEARAPFEFPSGGKLWGQYPPAFAYVAAPAALLGGMTLVSKMNVVLLGIAALLVFWVAQRVTDDPLAAAIAAALLLFSSPVFMASFETIAQPLQIVFTLIAVACAVVAVDADGRRALVFSVLAGATGALATSTHLIAFPMILALCVGLAVAGRPKRGAIALASLAVFLLPLSYLNHVRFGHWNPVAYAPCVWANCDFTVAQKLSSGSLLAFARPAGAWVAATAIALFFARRSYRTLLCVAVIAAIALVPHTIVRERVVAIVRTVYGYAVDMPNLAFADPRDGFVWFRKAEDGLGSIHYNGTTVRSLLQCTPFAALSLLAWVDRPARRRELAVIALPVVGLFAALSMLGRFQPAVAMSLPLLIGRYTVPATPLLIVLAVVAARGLRWRAWHFALIAGLATALALYFARREDDGPHLRRFLELRATLMAAAVAVLATWGARRLRYPFFQPIAPVACAVCAALGVAMVIGIDARYSIRVSSQYDARARRLDALVPERAALVGWGPELDPVLPIRAHRDLVYIDFTESHGSWVHFRELLDVWAAEGRPVFGVFPVGDKFVWPTYDWNVPAELIDEAQGVWRIGPAPPRVAPSAAPLPYPVRAKIFP